MSQNSSTRTVKAANGSKRSKYVSKACEPCRQRRGKCDGQKPTCSSCLKKCIACQYSVASDSRKPASKSYVQLLRDRIDLLECILRSHSIDVDTAISKYQNGLRGPSEDHSKDRNTTSAEFEEICAAFEGTLSLDESITFDGDGECHYFGPTSGRLQFQDCQSQSYSPKLIDLISTVQATGSDNQVCLTTSSRSFTESLNSQSRLTPSNSTPLQIDADFQAELIDLYFTWQNPWFPILDEAIFRRDLNQGTGRYFSPLLLNCVLSAGSRFSERSEVYTDTHDMNTAGDSFLREAEALLHHELLSPSLTTIQAAGLMIYLYVSRGADAVAWLYQGIAHRLALDMGLNIDATYVLGSNYMSPEEVGLRRQIYWSLYCTDKLHAAYSGRVCTMLDVQGAVKLPSLIEADDASDEISFRSQRTTAILRAHVTQNQILEKILLGFYAPQPSHTGSRRQSFFNATLVELKNWLYDLSDDLRLVIRSQPNTLPHVYIVHMTFHTALILLGNGILAHSKLPKTSDTDALHKKASGVCYEAATSICQVAKKYRHTFGSFQKSPIPPAYCLLSAALVLIQVASNGTDASLKRAAIANVDYCMQCLEELSVSWEIAGRIHRNLTLLKAQKVAGPSAQDSKPCTLAATPVLEEDQHDKASLPDMTDFLGFDPADAVLLNDTHSFLDNNDSTLENFDFAAQLADVGMQDSFLWSNFGLDFTPGPEF